MQHDRFAARRVEQAEVGQVKPAAFMTLAATPFGPMGLASAPGLLYQWAYEKACHDAAAIRRTACCELFAIMN